MTLTLRRSQGLKQIFQVIVANEDLEETDVNLDLAINFKITYKGGKISCEATAEKGWNNIMYFLPLKASPNRDTKEAVFVPISLNEKKFRMTLRSRLLQVFLNDPPFQVLDEFRMPTNRNRILEDSHGTKYQLLTLVTDDERTTYQRFVFSSLDDVYCVGTKEPHFQILPATQRDCFYLAAPIVDRVLLATIQFPF